MEIKTISGDEGKVVFNRFSAEVYEKLEALRKQANARGVATIVKLIVEHALAEGVTVTNDQPEPRPKKKRAA
jgi:hypothetical protein